jgi:hypothetical protein
MRALTRTNAAVVSRAESAIWPRRYLPDQRVPLQNSLQVL